MQSNTVFCHLSMWNIIKSSQLCVISHGKSTRGFSGSLDSSCTAVLVNKASFNGDVSVVECVFLIVIVYVQLVKVLVEERTAV